MLDNQFLLTTVEMGLVGLVALHSLLLGTAALVRSVHRRRPGTATAELAWALFASILVPLCSFATFDGLSFPLISGVLFLLLGCCGALWRLETPASRGARRAG